jgi:hypothetical protein
MESFQMNHSLLKLVSFAFALTVFTAYAAETLDSLRRKQTTLEQDLERVKTQISALEAKPEGQTPEQSAPSWFIKKFGIAEVDSAGGVKPVFVLFNPNSASPIKYVLIRATLHNAVGDAISSTTDNQSTKILRYTGPLSNADGEQGTYWGPIWYNTTGECIKVESVQVTFVTGKVVSLAGKNVRKALSPDLANECKLTKK